MAATSELGTEVVFAAFRLAEARLAETNTQVAVREQELKRLDDELTRRWQENTELVQHNEALKANIAMNEATTAKQDRDMATKQAEIDQLDRRILLMRYELAETRDELIDLIR
jgi:predicted RNase H-like nuclease (RuvC/YqgF family)